MAATLTPGNIVRIKATKQQGIIGSVDGESVLVMTKYERKWLNTNDVEQPIDGGSVAAQDTKKWLDAR